MLPVKYNPKHKITLNFSEEDYYIDSDKLDIFQKKMEESKFIRIGDSLIATSSIKTVSPVSQEVSMIESMCLWLPDILQDKIKRLVKERKSQEKTVTETYIQNIIDAR